MSRVRDRATEPTRDDLDDYRQRVRDWLASHEVPKTPVDLESRFITLRGWQRQLYDAGWLGIAWPKESGGQGLTELHQLVFNQEMVRHRAPSPVGLVGLEVVGPTVLEFGSEEQRRTLIPEMLKGNEIWCQGFSEPDSGSDLASLRTRAEKDGDSFVISGQKTWTSWAHKARWCGLLARTDSNLPKHKGISYLLVDMSLPGVSVRPIVQMTGDKEFSELFFDEVRVPETSLVGDLNRGWHYAMHTLSNERGPYLVKRSAEIAATFSDIVLELRRNGSLTHDELRDLGSLASLFHVVEAQSKRTVTRMLGEAGSTSPYDSLDKLMLTKLEQAVFGTTEDLLGAFRSTLEGAPRIDSVERVVHEYLYARAASIYGGSSQIQRNIVAERMLGLPRE